MKNEPAVYLLQQCGGLWVAFFSLQQPSGGERGARAAFLCVCVHVTRRDREKSLTISHAKSACERAAKRLPSARPSAELRRVQILHLALSLSLSPRN
jgi:hypothetical protein